IIAIVVVLPAPLPPSSPVMLPRAMRNEMSSTARVFLYCLTRRSTSMAAGPAGSAGDNEARLASFLVMRGRSLRHYTGQCNLHACTERQFVIGRPDRWRAMGFRLNHHRAPALDS